MTNSVTSAVHTVAKSGARASWLLSALVLGTVVTGCRVEMYDQPKAEPLELSTFFADSQASRPFLEGTIARTGRIAGAPDAAIGDTSQWMFAEPTTVAADTSQGAAAATQNRGSAPARRLLTAAEIRTMEIPIKVTRQVLERGRERFDIYCSPCHGRTGDANGMIVQRGFPRPPSYHLDRLRSAPDGHFYDVITNGFGAMYSYANRVKPDDRWAITAYIRALQLSRTADAPLRQAAGADTSGTARSGR